VSERSSILLMGRNTVIIGALLITIASFGIGYFFGFRGNGSPEQDKPTAQSAKTSEVIPFDEKRVIDLPVAGKPAAAPPALVKQSEPDAEPAAQKPPEPAVKAKGDAAGTQRIAEGPDKPDKQDKADKGQNTEARKSGGKVIAPAAANQAQDDASVQAAQAAKASQAGGIPAKSGKHAGEKAKKKAKNAAPSGKLYAVQVGAFPSKEGAEQLYQSLKAKGYNPNIVDASGNNAYFKVRVGTFSNKKVAEKSAAALLQKTGLQNFVTTVQ
jgi:cell division protein FtsN